MLSLIIAATAWPTMVTQNCSVYDKASLVGVAKSESGKVLYCESFKQIDVKSLQIIYVRDDEIFAEKELRFSSKPFMPSVSQKDFRSGELRQANISEWHVDLFYQPTSHKKIGEARIPMQKVDVVDAGFDNFVRANWDELEADKTLNINFASIAHLKTLPLRIRKQPLEKCLTKQEQNAPLTCFFVEIDNSLLRMILGNIKLTYDQKRRLYEFNGVTNIEDDKQNNQKAIIRYFYKEDYLSGSN